jgi:hypothetical protein
MPNAGDPQAVHKKLNLFAEFHSLMHKLMASIMLALLVLSAPATAQGVPQGAPVDGIPCDTAEGALLHFHPHVAISDHGKPVVIPEDVGRPLATPCLYWIHTHTPDGIVHIESPRYRTFKLGEFFDIWAQPLTRTNVAGAKVRKGEKVMVWVAGRLYAGDPRKIDLAQHLDIDIAVGPPYKRPAAFTAWNGN